MNLDELRAFLAVAETGSFSAAAKSLNFAREALARQMDELEAKSGVQLLRRAADGASVTRAGEALAKKGRALMTETLAILDAVRSLSGQESVISIEVPYGVPVALEETALATFRKIAPSVKWHIRYTNGVLDPQSGSTFALYFGDDPPEHDNWKQSRIAKVRVGLFASPKYIQKHGAPQSVAELVSRDLFIWDRHDRNPNYLPTVDGEQVEIAPAVVSPNPHLLRQLALAGHGISFSPSSKLAAFLDPTEPLQPILREAIRDEVVVWMSTRKGADSGAVGVLAGAISRFVATALKSMD
jgi:DNA-binding transcriptional LysR family regulator